MLPCRPDHQRIKEVGPNRACAEWLLRCGAHVRWKGKEKFHTDYNTLVSQGQFAKAVIEEVNVDEAAVMDIGFEHFGQFLHSEPSCLQLHGLPDLPLCFLDTWNKETKTT